MTKGVLLWWGGGGNSGRGLAVWIYSVRKWTGILGSSGKDGETVRVVDSLQSVDSVDSYSVDSCRGWRGNFLSSWGRYGSLCIYAGSTINTIHFPNKYNYISLLRNVIFLPAVLGKIVSNV